MQPNSDYSEVVRAALDGFWMLDNNGNCVDVNDAYCELSGYTREELLSMHINEVEANENPQDVLQHLQQIKTDGAGRFETRHRTKDGRMVDVEVSANYDSANNRFFVFLRDITQRKIGENTLRQRTQELSERIKELRCLLNLASVLDQHTQDLHQTLSHAVSLLPPAWKYPSIAAARLQLPGFVYATPGFMPTRWSVTREVHINKTVTGELTVAYIQPPPEDEHDPFLPEEYDLLTAVAQRLSDFLQRQRAEEALHARELSLNSLLELSQHASRMSEREIIQLALEEVERLTASELGYLHFVNGDQNSLELYTWSKQTLQHCNAAHDSHYPISKAGIWADCARQKRPVVHNDYQNYEGKKGYPVGHSHLARHVSVPVVEENSVKLILGVGNKASEYDDADVRQLVLTAENLWRIVRRKRAEINSLRDAERVATLAQVAAQLNSQIDLPDVLETVCKETARALKFPMASVCLYKPNETALCHTASASLQHKTPSNSVQEEIISLLTNVNWNEDIFSLPLEAMRRYVGRMLAVRLTRAEHTLGILAVYDLGTPQSWHNEDDELLRGLANLGAQAIVKARLFDEVSQSQEQLQTLSRRLVEVQEAERRNIAHELHDEVGQVLTAVKINLQTIRRQNTDSNYAERLDENIESVQRALEQVRGISLNLRPSILDDLGLTAALEWYTQRLINIAELNLNLNLPQDAPRWSPTVEITCFRVAQEALTNILRHAQATQVWVSLEHSPQTLHLQIRDNGRGFEPAAARRQAAQTGSSVGLLSMSERVALAGGELHVESAPGEGSTILVTFAF
jgi:PAS domain S-box-containing protein